MVTNNNPVTKIKTHKRHTFYVQLKIIEKLKDIAFWERRTLKDVVNEAFDRYISKCEGKKGRPYPRRKRERKGRRPG